MEMKDSKSESPEPGVCAMGVPRTGSEPESGASATGGKTTDAPPTESSDRVPVASSPESPPETVIEGGLPPSAPIPAPPIPESGGVEQEGPSGNAPCPQQPETAYPDTPPELAIGAAIEALGEQVAANHRQTNERVEAIAQDMSAIRKQLSFIPAKLRSVEDRVVQLRDAIGESKYQGLLKEFLRIHDLVDQIMRGLVDLPGCAVMAAQKRTCEVLKTQMRQILIVNGLQEIRADGTFDPELHQATGKIPTPDPDLDGKIARVQRPGFKTETTVLRYAECDVYGYVKPETSADKNCAS
jgi:molecular chaperone GrpE (heat shock protein)